jgi:regulator of protease activity HflC (stomatin/prohibitin superfamily)
MDPLALFVTIVVAIFLTYTAITAVRRVGEHERGIVFRLGRALPAPRGPGIVLIAPYGVDRMKVIDVRTGEVTVPPQTTATKDGEAVRLGAAVYYRVADPVQVAVQVPNHRLAVAKATEGTLKAIARERDLAELTKRRGEVAEELTTTLGALTEPWGIAVSEAEITEVIEVDQAVEPERSR